MKIELRSSRMNQFQTSDGFSISYVDEGSGPAVLLLHGVPTSSYLYRKIIPLLASKKCRAIAPDILGYGSSSKPKGYEVYSSEFQGFRILEAIKSPEIQDWIQLSHDMGVLVNWNILQSNSDKVTGFIILNTIIYKEGFNPPLKFKRNILTK